ncbi:MAG: hypothetical protein A2081_02235 [Elusimicrobia bacterium GWC2_61_19]|nr:MAG: hypothetical protein A2081_02235 [Elusimicrobia bacterium GWC2_61_19]
MKPCPSCGYGNSDTGLKCGICARDISAVPVLIERPPEKEAWPLILTGLLLMLCGLAFFVTGNFADKPARPASGETEFSDEASFSYDGVIYALDKMGQQRFLPSGEKRKVAPLIYSHDDRVACAAVRLIGGWLRSGEEPGDEQFWRETLAKAASAGSPAVRLLAAQEAVPAAGLKSE